MKHKITFTILFTSLVALVAFTPKETSGLQTESLGEYSISLNVADIAASNKFYNHLGFNPVEGLGGVDQKWMILSNGKMKIGLFQGLFPSNTITFNPNNARVVFKSLTDKGIQPTFQTGIDKKEGPCTFSIIDPDGNPILIDQH